MPKPLFANHPYTDGPKNQPIHFTKENIGHFIYPDDSLDYSDYNQIFVSTEQLTICTMDIGPGGFFDPPDYHPGDEMYFVLKGAITQYNPVNGQVIRVPAGESLLIPKGGAHMAFNFEETTLRIMAVIAPKIVDNQLFPTDGERMPRKLFNGPDNASMPKNAPFSHDIRMGTTDDIGSWPCDGGALRDTGYLYHITEDKKLLAIHGRKHPTLVKLSVSNDFMQVGEYILPFGGSVTRYMEPMTHRGQAFLYAYDKQLTVFLPVSRETIILLPGEGLYLPEQTAYQLVNYGDCNMRALFATAPGI